MCYALCFGENFLDCFALPRRLGGGMITYRDDGDGLFRLRHLEKLMATLGVEIADPTCAKPLLGGCQTEMLHGDGDVDIAVRLAVSTNPFLFMQKRGKNIQRGFAKPRTRVARLKLFPTLRAADDAEFPRLAIHRRWGEPHTLFEVRNFFLLYRLVEITATTVAALNDVDKSLHV